MRKKHLLKTSEYFSYEKTENCKGIDFEVYMDDYGMCFVLAYRHPITNEICEWCCGTYTDYHWDMEDIADHLNSLKQNNESINNKK